MEAAMASPLTGIRACVFDAYGTLFDFASAAKRSRDVLGDKTFGVGSVQKVIEVPDGSALILSIAKYYSPSGKAIQDSAVTPNILVADADDDAILTDDDEAPPSATDEKKPAKQPEDEQLKRAVESLKNRG